ncbi:hypothetical protein BTR23_00940 [Alkalihalophilus pseudofirmus]|nr:hypothetical protein BTR23_00940 [Alkalihalophilus pseudofirmus]
MVTKSSMDQAGELRKQMEQVENAEEINLSSLPPRSEFHKVKKNKKRKFRIRFPLVRLFLILFLLIVILALSSPFWLEYISQR